MEPSSIDVTTLIGLIAACLTTAAYVPQTWRTIKTKSTEDLALSTFQCFL
ncbi:MAG: SemiSWEET family sugar transporter [Flammeovirgaceae bacterium]